MEIEYRYEEYADSVLNKKIVVGEAIYLACKRYKEWKNRKDIYFDKDDVERKIRIISKLKHFTGVHNGKPFILLPWQQWCIANIFGWKYINNNLRVTKKVFMMLPRKSGKTAFAAAIGICCMIADKEANAEIELVANNRQQAHIAFDITKNFIESIDRKGKFFKKYRDSIVEPKSKSKIQVLSSDAMGNDGYNCSCFILDEFHAARNWELYNVMKSSQGMRAQPLAIIITTAGFLLNGYPCYEQRLNCLEILKGSKKDDSQFSAIYELDEGDDWQNEDNWPKVSPSLGQTVRKEYLIDQIQEAKNNPAKEVGVLTKDFNRFCQSKEVWIPEKYLLNAFKPVDINDFKDEEAYMGVDLSATSDLTCTSILFPPNKNRDKYPEFFVIKNYLYIPQAAIDESSNSEFYKLWIRQGYCKYTSGNAVDYDGVLKDQIKLYEHTYLNKIGYDSWNATQWAINATAEGLPLFQFSQALGNFNRPTKEFERLIRQGKIIIDTNPCVRWQFNNVELKTDWNDNSKPTKANSDNNRKIDTVISMIEALGTYLSNVNYNDGEVLAV